jgi:hypothetical protein
MDIDQLIAMDDAEVRKQVGESFRAQLRAHPAVNATFFGAPAANPAPPPELTDFVGDVASALVAWSLATTTAYGFNATADAALARAYVNGALNWPETAGVSMSMTANMTEEQKESQRRRVARESKAIDNQSKFRQLAWFNYGALFPQYCAKDGVTFQQYLDKPETWGPAVADTLSSDAFIINRALSKTADPADFYQGLYHLLYKVYRLAPSRLDSVVAAWSARKLADAAEERPWDTRFRPPVEKLAYGWTNYERMQAAYFSEQTFFSDVQNAVTRGTETGRRQDPRYTNIAFAGPVENRNRQEHIDMLYGAAVVKWLADQRPKHEFLTGQGVSNQVTQSHPIN